MYGILLNIAVYTGHMLYHFDAAILASIYLQAGSRGFLPMLPWVIAIISVISFLTAFFLGRYSIKIVKKADEVTPDEAIEAAGYGYDPEQDAFFSIMNAWQRKCGYCRIYDEAAAPLGMIIDCEPVNFEYQGKKWLIEFWKGQYDLTTGCEIGVYTDPVELKIPGVFLGTFYNSASDNDLIYMVCILRKNGKKLFKREGLHWWLTGFKLGVFSQPSELVMDVKVTLKDSEMCDAFIKGLLSLGYTEDRVRRLGNTVSFTFDKPLSKQPITRIEKTDWIIQEKNKMMCDIYQDITKAYPDMPQKMLAYKAYAPLLYNKAVDIGKSRQVFGWFDTIKRYIS